MSIAEPNFDNELPQQPRTYQKSLTSNDVFKIGQDAYTVGVFTVFDYLSGVKNSTVLDDLSSTVDNLTLKTYILGKIPTALNGAYVLSTSGSEITGSSINSMNTLSSQLISLAPSSMSAVIQEYIINNEKSYLI